MSRADDYVRLVLCSAPEVLTTEQQAVIVAAATRPVPTDGGGNR